MGILLLGMLGPTAKTLIGADHSAVGMFKNMLMGSTNFPSTDVTVDPSIIDINGYPVSTPPADFGRSISFSSQLTTSDTLVLKWTGVADMKFDMGAPGVTVVSDPAGLVQGGTGFSLRVKSTTNVACKVTFQFNTSVPTSAPFYFMSGVAGLFNGTLTGLVLCLAADEAAIAAATTPEELLSDNFVNKYKELSPKIIRTMDCTNPNFGNQSQSRYITPWQTGISCLGERWIPNAWAGSSSGTNSYTCSSPTDSTGSYVNGEVVQLKFINASTGSVTLNSGTRGAVPVYSTLAVQLGNGSIPANTLATCVYDSVLGGFMYKAGGITSTIPYEYQIALANRVDCNIWLNLPAYYDNTSISAIAALARTQLSSSRTAYFEYSNEMWNGGFPAYHWAYVKGATLGFTATDGRTNFGWQALRTREAMGLVTTAWSPRTSSQLKRVMPFQCFGASSSAIEPYLFKGSDLAPSGTHTGSGNATYNTYTGSADYTQSPDRPIDYCDVMSYATYYSGAQLTNFDANYTNHGASAIAALLTAADDYATGVPASMTSALAFVDNDIRAGTLSGSGTAGAETLLALSARYTIWNALAVTYNKTIELYEGGHESWYPSTATCTALGISTSYGGSTGKIAVLLGAYKNNALFQTLVTDQYSQFAAGSKSTTWAWLVLTGVSQWGAMQGSDIFTATYKSWDAQVALNH